MSDDSNAKFWDNAAPSYSRSAISDEAGYQKTLDRTRSFLKPTDRVLELGCGTGSAALVLAGSAQSYLATDISPGMIKIAEEKYAGTEGGIPGLNFRAAVAETLQTEEERFTAVLGFNYLHLVSDVPATIQTIHTLLEDGGLFITKTACLNDSLMYKLMATVVVPLAQFIGKAPPMTSLHSADLEEKIRAAGFDILCSEMHASKGTDIRPFIVARKMTHDSTEA